ncbi:MAG: phosphate ABC transporter substrate-binding protein [Bacteroidota bacterium]|nr:phosphate ABC transporter substrate-binding protein [Bacteroidota bacterium]
MKKVGLLALLTLIILYPAWGQKASVKIKGSDTCLPVIQKESEQFLKKNAGAVVMVTGGGSGVGISALIGNNTDIAMSSRRMKLDEKFKVQKAGKELKEKVFAYDALSVVVHPSNKISQLTREQLEKIFTGKVKNWNEVGGANMQIVVYSRESSSGTYEFFKDKVLKNKNFAASVLSMPATGSIIQSVSQTKGAIGYVGMAYVEKNVKSVKVSFDGGKTFVAPSVETARSKTYPIARPLYLYYFGSSEAKVKPFVSYVFSAEGQKIVQVQGYVPL